jgi:hypothetical protein
VVPRWGADERYREPTAEDLLAAENPYLPPDEWRRRVETWSQVNEWHRALYRHPHWPPNPEGGPLEELRARVDERWLRESVIPWREKHARPS